MQIEFSPANTTELLIGTMPVNQSIRIGHYLEFFELCRSPNGQLFELHSRSSAESILMTTPFASPRGWADLMAPALTHYHDAIILRCAAVWDNERESLLLIMGKSGAGKTTSLETLTSTYSWMTPLADDHLGLIPHQNGFSIFTPIWDKYGAHNCLLEHINSADLVILNSQCATTRGQDTILTFLLGQILCSSIHVEITASILSRLDFLLRRINIHFLHEIDDTTKWIPLENLWRVLHE